MAEKCVRRNLFLGGSVIFSLVAFLLAAGSIQAQETEFYACIDAKGKLREISQDAGLTCRKSETRVFWSQTGPSGENGAAGTTRTYFASGSTAGSDQIPLPTTGAVEVLRLDLPAGTYLLSGKINLINNDVKASRAICVLARGFAAPSTFDEVADLSRVDLAGQSTGTLPLQGVLKVNNSTFEVSLACSSSAIVTPLLPLVVNGGNLSATLVDELVDQSP